MGGIFLALAGLNVVDGGWLDAGLQLLVVVYTVFKAASMGAAKRSAEANRLLVERE